MVVKYHDYWDLLGATQHREFEDKLADILLKKDEREAFYKKLVEVKPLLSEDTFKEYFELYAAERKTNQQDFTPQSVADLLSIITGDGSANGRYNGYDAAAGTGALIISKWHHDRMAVGIGKYRPHNHTYCVEELSDTAIPYLLHNLAYRGMNVAVLHGDSIERKYKQIYFIQNSTDDIMKFSDINVFPHTENVAKMFNVKEWMQEAIKHIESKEVTWIE